MIERLRFVRTIVAMLIAWSVALAPTWGMAAAFLPSGVPSPQHAGQHDHAAAVRAHAHQHGPEQGIASPCCDDEGGAPERDGPGDCSTMPGCALKCFGGAEPAKVALAPPLSASMVLAWHVSRAIAPEPPAPPFHPPRF